MRLIAALLLAASCAFSTRADATDLAQADALWARRAEQQREGRPLPERAGAVVAAYEQALGAAPASLEAHWKLLRALWFQAYFAGEDDAAKRRLYERALAVSEQAFARLAEQVGGREALERMQPDELAARLPQALRRDAAELYFWYAVDLGAWSRLAGLLQAVRAGVAGRLHEATLRSIALDPDVEQGGALRLLSRLHSELPRVPLFSGWVDPDRAVPLAERARAEYPRHPGNAYLLGLALLSHAPERRDEGLRLVEATALLEPRADHVIEDLAIQSDAREKLASEGRRG
jgi:hypothetical protein